MPEMKIPLGERVTLNGDPRMIGNVVGYWNQNGENDDWILHVVMLDKAINACYNVRDLPPEPEILPYETRLILVTKKRLQPVEDES